MGADTFEYFTALGETISREDWKLSLDSFFIALRRRFVFDNLAIYLVKGQENALPEVIFARAIGRGKSREAEASWGEDIANRVFTTWKVVVETPQQPSSDRISMPYLIGLPLSFLDGRGALVFVRFGGPEYLDDQVALAALAAAQTARTLERSSLREHIAQLEFARHRAQLQDDFISTVSHDLHTPLGFIKGYATSLLRADTSWDAATQREFLTIIDEETDHLIQLIDRQLDSARLQTGTMAMDFQYVRLENLVRDVVLRMRGRQPGLEVQLDFGPVPPIQADNVRLGQVFDNLLDNASKYAPGSKVTIKLAGKGDRVQIDCSDKGPGIPAEHLPHIFERFYRVPGQSSKRGTGLGLFICKQIVQAHHGRMTVRTASGKGTSFRIELPISQEKGRQT